MSTFLYYQAMPEESRLFRRLCTEQPLCMMYCELIHHSRGPYDTDRLNNREMEGYLNSIAVNPVFGSREVVDRVFADLRAELETADREYPGLRNRSAYMQANDYFDASLVEALNRAGRDDGEELTDRLVMGDGAFAPEGFGTGNLSLQLVPSELVATAAELFRRFGAGDMAEYEDEFTEFRQVFYEAAQRGEAVVIA